MRAIPAGAWDSHVHVVDEDIFPLHQKHAFRPKKSDLQDLLKFESTIGCDHVCLIAFSVYHDDNRSLLDALSRLGGKARAVACISPDTITEGELDSMHDLGVRGVRLNLKSYEAHLDAANMKETLLGLAEKIRNLGWCLQIYADLSQMASVEPLLPRLGVPLVIDHLGVPHGRRPAKEQEGFEELFRMLATGQVWTKLSPCYRFEGMEDLDDYVRSLLRVAPDRIVYASDFPNGYGAKYNPGGNRDATQPYRDVDHLAFIDKCWEWCDEDETLWRKIFVDNPRRLWQYDGDD